MSRSYALEPEESACEGIARVAGTQLDHAIERLAHPEQPEAVHDARKALKRLRSLLRVSRPLLDERTYRRENSALRDVGRGLSATRDAQALIEALDRLQARRGSELPAASTGELRVALATAVQVTDSEPVLLELQDTLRAVGSRSVTWSPAGGSKRLLRGFARNYERGRTALRRARRDPDVEHLHELRKRAKDLWYGSQLLRREHPQRMKAIGRRAHQLSDLLGEHHDLALLHERAVALEGTRDSELIDAIDRELAALGQQALRRARKLYRRGPRQLRRRLRG